MLYRREYSHPPAVSRQDQPLLVQGNSWKERNRTVKPKTNKRERLINGSISIKLHLLCPESLFRLNSGNDDLRLRVLLFVSLPRRGIPKGSTPVQIWSPNQET
ncbi:hypothetical protein V8G54_004981 [Vigna mungo]|uniref:Uncharacterized protein n=1 Tax=Vigna mungo TaxID=3915 RepID=A0AAQ3PJ16_VIGMU